MNKAADAMARDHETATQYLLRRPENTLAETALERLMKQLKWRYRSADTIEADLYGCKIVHELKPGVLHSWPCWGELFFGPSSEEEPVQFDTLECFAAFVLARWW